MKIGQVAREAGVSIDTVRFYERRGILPAAARRPSGYRVFTAATVERIRMARALQSLGLTLDEVIDALHAHDQGDATCESERWRLEAVVERLDAKITELQHARHAAVRALDDCQHGQCRLVTTATNDPAQDQDPDPDAPPR
jgi:DNA-binding transcriptional MerR regulator